MIQEKLDESLISNAEILTTNLSSTQLKLQEIQENRLALAEVIKVSKKNRNTNALLQYFNIRIDLGIDDDISNTAAKDLGPKIKCERESIELQGTPMHAPLKNINEVLVKEERMSFNEEPNLMPPPTTRPKRGRKKNAEKGSITSSGSSSSTRSSARSTRSNILEETDVICTELNLECISLSDDEPIKDEVKKVVSTAKRSTRSGLNASNVKKEEMPPPITHTRSTRTKTRNQLKADETNNETITMAANETKVIAHDETTTINGTADIEQKQVNGIESSKKEIDSKADDRSKRLRSPVSDQKKKPNIKRSKSDNSESLVEGDISGQTVYEDAFDVQRESCKLKLNAVVRLENINTTSKLPQKTTAATNSKTNGNSALQAPANTTVIISPNRVIINNTIVYETKIEDQNYNDVDGIMTDDESPPPTVSKSKIPSATHHQTKVVKKMTGVNVNGSPVKKLVQAFEKMVKVGGVDKERVTPTATRQLRNATPTQQNKLYTGTGSASKANPIPISGVKAGGVIRSGSTASTTASAIKRSQQEFHERELLRRQKEEESRKKREQQMQAQAEERRKRIEAQELKIHQVQQKKELLKQQKLQHLDEQQRVKDEKARLVLQEKQDKHKEELEKKRQRLKKHAHDGSASTKPIYMVEAMPLLYTTDCYDSDEENANVKTSRVKPTWTMRDQLYHKQRIMSHFGGPSVRNDFFATKPCTPNLIDIFQDIDPIKLSRTSSAVWRKPPRATLMHLPSFTEEPEPTD